MQETTVISKNAEIAAGALAVRKEAAGIAITDDSSFNLAGEILKRLVEAKKNFETSSQFALEVNGVEVGTYTGKLVKDQLNKLKQVVIDEEKAFLEPLDALIGKLKNGIGSFAQQRELERRKAQARLEEEARKQHDQMFLDAADDLEKSGSHEEAAMIIESAIHHQPTVTLPSMAKPKGIGTGETWTFEVVDPELVPRGFLIIDEKKLGEYARVMKEFCNDQAGKSTVPGVRFFTKPKVTVRTR